jgi:hypothetical protein
MSEQINLFWKISYFYLLFKVNGVALAEQRALVDDLLDRIERALDRLSGDNHRRAMTDESTRSAGGGGGVGNHEDEDGAPSRSTTASDIGKDINELRSHSLRIGVNTMQLERLIHLVVRASANANKSPLQLFFFFFFFFDLCLSSCHDSFVVDAMLCSVSFGACA